MKKPFGRGIVAALLLSLASTPAIAGSEDNNAFPAIAAGMAIPVGPSPNLVSQIPARGRFVLIDAASARLFMIEDGQVRDSMRVIVGKPGAATPMLKSTLHYATLNPYWNVPTDLAASIIAPRVLKDGTSYLRQRGYQVVSNFGAGAEVLDPRKVDWKAVAAGRERVFVRQLPGPANSMGEMKFGLTNVPGIYLHDTPNKDLFEEAQRNLSNGCVRLEDAPRFARWLMGNEPALQSKAPEQLVQLPRGVPIAITYLDRAADMQLASLR